MREFASGSELKERRRHIELVVDEDLEATLYYYLLRPPSFVFLSQWLCISRFVLRAPKRRSKL
jgi:hypothetical protein